MIWPKTRFEIKNFSNNSLPNSPLLIDGGIAFFQFSIVLNSRSLIVKCNVASEDDSQIPQDAG